MWVGPASRQVGDVSKQSCDTGQHVWDMWDTDQQVAYTCKQGNHTGRWTSHLLEYVVLLAEWCPTPEFLLKP